MIDCNKNPKENILDQIRASQEKKERFAARVSKAVSQAAEERERLARLEAEGDSPLKKFEKLEILRGLRATSKPTGGRTMLDCHPYSGQQEKQGDSFFFFQDLTVL